MGVLRPEQAQEITRLRGLGMGYKLIAAELELSRDTVRNYCRKNNLDGDVGTDPLSEGVCRQCGQPLDPEAPKSRKFCSDACRWKWWNAQSESAHRPMSKRQEVRCANCGKVFIAYQNKGRRYCSHACYIRDGFWSREVGREPYISPSNK